MFLLAKVGFFPKKSKRKRYVFPILGYSSFKIIFILSAKVVIFYMQVFKIKIKSFCLEKLV